MLTLNDLRKVAARSGARDIANVEIDVILTHLLQLFTEAGIADHVAFKGGTMLRKMVFGPRGRLSTDLDFTRHTDIEVDDLLMLLLDRIEAYLHKRYLYLKEKPRTSFEEMELLKGFGFDKLPRSVNDQEEAPTA